MSTVSRLAILIDARNNASKELQAVGRDAEGLSKNFSGLAKGAGVVAVALGALKAGEAAFAMGRASAESARLADSFVTLAKAAGGSSQQMLAAMREASKGMIDDTSLIGAANRAMLLGVADTSGEMATLLEIAGARAKAMGLTTQQAFGDLVTGLGRMSPMILDNLGITIDAAGAYERYAESIGRSAESLDDAEKKQALVNEVIRTSSTLLEENAGKGRDLAGSFERMDASIANAKDALGALFSPAAAAIAEGIADATDKATGAMMAMAGITDPFVAINDSMRLFSMLLGNANSNTEMGRAAIAAMGEQYNALAAQLGRPMIDITASAREGMVVFGQVSIDTAMSLTELSGETDNTVVALQHMAAMAAQAGPNVDNLRSQIVGLIDVQRELNALTAGASGALRSSFLSTAGKQGAGDALAGFEAANRGLNQQTALWEQQGRSVEEIRFLQAEYVQGIQEANRELGRTATATSAIGSATDAIAQKFEELKGKVAGVLSAALDTGVGVNPDDFLPRPDAINEDARRLADIVVRGFESPWASYLQDKFPDMFGAAMESTGGNIQQAAATLLKDFQDGLNPSLIDKDAAKERVKRMLLGDASMAEMAAEIASELQAEMGGQFSLAQIQQAAGSALGTQATTDGAGTAAGEGLLTGMLDKAGTLAAALDAKLQAQYKALFASGQNAGGQWGNGFLDTVGQNVPAALIGILVQLVTPGVYGQLQAMRSQTEAGQ